jgi:sugar fermentation stimulation protein A
MRLPLLFKGRILKRYKRFLADVELEDGRRVTAHCANTGSMKTCWEPGAPVEVSHSDNPRRKLAWTLERVDMGGGWIGVHTGRTNAVVSEGVQRDRIPGLSGYSELRLEVTVEWAGIPRSRLDLQLLGGSRPDAYVEVKNVTLLEGDHLMFPDAVTTRGRRHLDVLAEACRRGYRGVMVYALNRPEGRCFSPAEAIDPDYAKRLREVAVQGVEPLAVRIVHTDEGLHADGLVEMDL